MKAGRLLQPTASFLGPASFYRSALILVIPVMLQSFLTGFVSLVDNFMVAALGDSKMAGVNVANQINFIYLVVINTACMAGGIYLSQHGGAGDREGMRQAFRFKLILALIISAAYTLICLFLAEPLIGLMLGGNVQVDDGSGRLPPHGEGKKTRMGNQSHGAFQDKQKPLQGNSFKIRDDALLRNSLGRVRDSDSGNLQWEGRG
ncbi:MAG: MATE family efflux transporter [Rectinemataceae bacterium]